MDDNAKDSGVCATCVVRLRDASALRRQLLQCEELFLNAKLQPDKNREGLILFNYCFFLIPAPHVGSNRCQRVRDVWMEWDCLL